MEDQLEHSEAAVPLTPEQRALLNGFDIDAMQPLSIAVHIGGALDVQHLRKVVAEELQEHESLRMAVRRDAEDSGWRQQPLSTLALLPAEAPLRPRDGSMVGLTLERIDEFCHHLRLSVHPLAADSVSLAALIERINSGCDEGVEPSRAFQYTQFAVRRAAPLMQGARAAQAQAHWASYQRDPFTLVAPRLVLRQGGASTPGPRRVLTRTLDTILQARLHASAEASGVSAAELVQAAWWALIARLTGFKPFSGGWQYDCRNSFELMQDAIGVYEKVLPVRVLLAAREPFEAWLARFGAEMRQHVQAQEYFAPDGLPTSYQAVGFALHLSNEERSRWRVVERPGPLPCFELALELEWSPRCAVLALHGMREHYEDAALSTLLRQLSRLLQVVADAPATPLGDLPLSDDDELCTLLGLEGASLEPAQQDLTDRIAHWAVRTPAAPAIEDGERCLSYADLDARINSTARWLQLQGVKAGALVALEMPRSLQLVVAMLAAWRAGAAYLPLEPSWPQAWREVILADARPALLLQGASELDGIRLDAACPDVKRSPNDLAYVVYTSGSTGRPKGVMIEHAQVLNYVAAVSEALPLTRGRRWALTSTVAADLGNTALFGALFHGACLVVAGDDVTKDAAAFTRFVTERHIDALKIVPSHLEALLEAEATALPELLILGGEATSPALLARIGQLSPQAVVCNHYGPTETTVGVMVHRRVAGEQGSMPLTQVLANNRVRVLDAVGRLTPVGAQGEVYVGGAQLCRGYMGGVASTFFIDDSFRPGERLYRTGDLAYVLPDGALHIVGRTDHQLKVRGFRVEPGEIEATVLAQPGVRQAVVVPGPAGEDGTAELVAYVVGDCKSLRERLATLLPAPMVPARCVEVAALPRLANGKIDRASLTVHVAAPAVQENPRDALEQELARIMAEVLGRSSISRDDDFLELGGHSLLAIKLAARVRRQLQLEMTPGLVFDHPSVGALARALRAELGEGET